MLLLLSVLFLTQPLLAAKCDLEYAKLLAIASPENPGSPSMVGLLESEKDIQAGFNLAAAAWDKAYKPALLKRKLIRLQGDPHSLEELAPAFLELERRTGLLIQAHEAFSATAKVPSALKNFSTGLAALNQAVNKSHPLSEIRKFARNLELGLAKLEVSKDTKELAPIPPATLRERATQVTKEIFDITGDDLPTPKKIGVVTKKVAALLTVARAHQVLHPSPETLATYGFIARVAQDLKKLHEDFLHQAKAGEIDYDRQKFFLNPTLRERLKSLAQALLNTLSSSGALPK